MLECVDVCSLFAHILIFTHEAHTERAHKHTKLISIVENILCLSICLFVHSFVFFFYILLVFICPRVSCLHFIELCSCSSSGPF